MRTFFFLLICLLAAGCKKNNSSPGDCGILQEMDTSSRTLNILFIGTSHTFYNDLPKTVSAIAKSVGDNVHTEMSAPGGYDFERHFVLEATKTALNSRKWDYIVLQESGWRTALPPSLTQVRVYPFADSLLNLVKRNNATARLVLYMTNGYTNGVNTFGDTAWCKSDPQVCSFDGMVERIKGTYLQLGKQLNAEIAPCGVMWKILKSRKNDIVLHDADGIHPAPLASYLNALTIYTIIRKKPLKNVFIPSSVSNAESVLIQNTVADVLFDCNPGWKNY